MMSRWTTVAGLPRLLAAALLAAGCSDALSPERPRLGTPVLDVVGGQQGGTLNESGTVLLNRFLTNPHHGDAIVATFFWLGSCNIITSVTDHLSDANQTPVNNQYNPVDCVTSGGIAMATYVATNVQNFPDASSDASQLLVVQANLSTSVQDGGVMLSAYGGVAGVYTQALGGHSSASGSGSTYPTVADPGAIAVNAGGLAYAVTMASPPAGADRPPSPPWHDLATQSDARMISDAEYMVPATTGPVHPTWNWYFSSSSTWLATVLALNSGTPPPPPAPATHLVFSVQPSATTASSTISPPVQVSAKDDAGNTDPSFTGAVTVALGTNPSGGALSGTKTVTAASGVATFSNLSIDKAGNGYTLQATNGSLTGATSAAFNITAPAPPPAGGVALDQCGTTACWNAAFQESGPTLIKGFNPTNPHHGDAIVATFFWVGSCNIIDSVTDVLTTSPYTPVGNKYNLVDNCVTAGGVAMATYVATNVQNFPDPNPDQSTVLAVRASLSTPVSDGGIIISAWSGIQGVYAQALNGHSSASGSGSTYPTVADPGAIAVSAGGLAYAVTMASPPAGADRPPSWTDLVTQSDARMIGDVEYVVPASTGPVHPTWNWYFSSSSTWLATALSLNPAAGSSNQPPVAAFGSSCSVLTCSFTSTSSDPDGSISAYSWTFGDGGTSAVQNPSYTYGAGGTYTVTLTVTDNLGATNSTSHSVTVNRPPVASFTQSCSGDACSFTSTSSDPDGSISAYSWTFGDGGTSTAQNPSHTYATGGTYTAALTVTDNLGATNSTSKSITVTAPHTAPTVNAGPNETNLTGLFYSESATFSDPDNGPWTYRIDWGDGSSTTGSTSSQGTISAGHTYLLLGSYTIKVTVTDSLGASGSDTKSVTFIL